MLFRIGERSGSDFETKLDPERKPSENINELEQTKAAEVDFEIGKEAKGKEGINERLEEELGVVAEKIISNNDDLENLIESNFSDRSPEEKQKILEQLQSAAGKEEFKGHVKEFLTKSLPKDFTVGALAGFAAPLIAKIAVKNSARALLASKTFGVSVAAGAIANAVVEPLRHWIRNKEKIVAKDIEWQLAAAQSSEQQAAIIAQTQKSLEAGRFRKEDEAGVRALLQEQLVKVHLETNKEGLEGKDKVLQILEISKSTRRALFTKEGRAVRKLINSVELLTEKNKVGYKELASASLKGALTGAVGGAVGGALHYFLVDAGYGQKAVDVIGEKLKAGWSVLRNMKGSGGPALAFINPTLATTLYGEVSNYAPDVPEKEIPDAVKQVIANKAEQSFTTAPQGLSEIKDKLAEQAFYSDLEQGNGGTHLARKALHDYRVNLIKSGDPDAANLSTEQLIFAENWFIKHKLDKYVEEGADHAFKLGEEVKPFDGADLREAIEEAKKLNEEQLKNLHKYVDKLSEKTIHEMHDLQNFENAANDYTKNIQSPQPDQSNVAPGTNPAISPTPENYDNYHPDPLTDEERKAINDSQDRFQEDQATGGSEIDKQIEQYYEDNKDTGLNESEKNIESINSKLIAIAKLNLMGGILLGGAAAGFYMFKKWQKERPTPEQSREAIEQLLRQRELEVELGEGVTDKDIHKQYNKLIRAIEQDYAYGGLANLAGKKIVLEKAHSAKEPWVDHTDPEVIHLPVSVKLDKLERFINQLDDDAIDQAKEFSERKLYEAGDIMLDLEDEFQIRIRFINRGPNGVSSQQLIDNLDRFRNALRDLPAEDLHGTNFVLTYALNELDKSSGDIYIDVVRQTDEELSKELRQLLGLAENIESGSGAPILAEPVFEDEPEDVDEPDSSGIVEPEINPVEQARQEIQSEFNEIERKHGMNIALANDKTAELLMRDRNLMFNLQDGIEDASRFYPGMFYPFEGFKIVLDDKWALEKGVRHINIKQGTPKQIADFLVDPVRALRRNNEPAASGVDSIEVRNIEGNESNRFFEENEVQIHGSAYEFSPGSFAKLEVKDLVDAGLEPKHTVVVGSTELRVSQPYNLDNGRLAAMVYVKQGDVYVPRSYYKSNSAVSWRYLPTYSREYDPETDRYNRHYDKGYDEDSLDATWEVQMALTKIAAEPNNIINTPKDPEFYMFGTCWEKDKDNTYQFSVDELGETYNGQFKVPESDRQKHENVGGFLEFTGVNKLEPEKVGFANHAFNPNFAEGPIAEWPDYSHIYGAITNRVFQSKNKQLTYVIHESAEGKVWMNIQTNTELTPVGVRKKWFDGGDLTSPAYEYKYPKISNSGESYVYDQTGGYGDDSDRRGSYVDMFKNYNSKIPIIKEYREWRNNPPASPQPELVIEPEPVKPKQAASSPRDRTLKPTPESLRSYPIGIDSAPATEAWDLLHSESKENPFRSNIDDVVPQLSQLENWVNEQRDFSVIYPESPIVKAFEMLNTLFDFYSDDDRARSTVSWLRDTIRQLNRVSMRRAEEQANANLGRDNSEDPIPKVKTNRLERKHGKKE